MTIKFDGKEIKGTHGALVAQMPELQTVRTYFWGLAGMSEVVGGRGGRAISCDIWLHDNYGDRNKIETAVKKLNKKIGDHGTLIESDSTTGHKRTYKFCTFEGFEPLPFGGRQEADPIPDVGNTLDGGWLMHGRLRWYQLETDKD